MKRRSGFTLVELSLALVFVGILALTVALIITDMVTTYRRGLTLSSINATGMDLADDMRASLASSSAKSVRGACISTYNDDDAKQQECLEDGGKVLTLATQMADFDLDGTGSKRVPVYGAMCTGTYSYLWNSGYVFNGKYGGDELSVILEKDGGEETYGGFGMLKVDDRNRMACAQLNERIGGGATYDIKIADSRSEPEELLKVDGNDNSLALYDLDMATPAESDAINSVFYSVSFILGTVGGGINVMAEGNYCATPEGSNAEAAFDYCAINKFNFAVQATGE